jgi:hypothetical protein
MRLKMKHLIIAALLGWYVMTYSGQKVAGPFTQLSECTEWAKWLHAKYYNVSEVCLSRN